MLDRLGRRQQARVMRRAALEFVHDLLAFGNDAFDGVAGLAARALADQFEDLGQAFDLGLGFLFVHLERGFQFLVLCGARHLAQRGRDLALGIVDVLQGFVEQRVKRLVGHGKLLGVSRPRCQEWQGALPSQQPGAATVPDALKRNHNY